MMSSQQSFIFTDEESILCEVRNYAKQIFEKEQKYIIDNLPDYYCLALGTVGSYNGRPVQILSPCSIPPGELRKRWIESFVKMEEETNELKSLPYLVYWFDSPEIEPYKRITIESSNDFVPYDECAKKGIQIVPHSSPGNLLNVDDCIAILQEFSQAEKNGLRSPLNESADHLLLNMIKCEAVDTPNSVISKPVMSNRFSHTCQDETPEVKIKESSLPDILKLGDRISVYWDFDKQYHDGVVDRIRHPGYLISYDDGESHWAMIDEMNFKKLSLCCDKDTDDDNSLTNESTEDDDCDRKLSQEEKADTKSKNNSSTEQNVVAAMKEKESDSMCIPDPVVKIEQGCESASSNTNPTSNAIGQCKEEEGITPPVQAENSFSPENNELRKKRKNSSSQDIQQRKIPKKMTNQDEESVTTSLASTAVQQNITSMQDTILESREEPETPLVSSVSGSLEAKPEIEDSESEMEEEILPSQDAIMIEIVEFFISVVKDGKKKEIHKALKKMLKMEIRCAHVRDGLYSSLRKMMNDSEEGELATAVMKQLQENYVKTLIVNWKAALSRKDVRGVPSTLTKIKEFCLKESCLVDASCFMLDCNVEELLQTTTSLFQGKEDVLAIVDDVTDVFCDSD